MCALAIWVAVDSFGLYPLAKWSGKDDIFAGAWIAIFTGFAFFCTCIFGVLAALWRSKGLVLTVRHRQKNREKERDRDTERGCQTNPEADKQMTDVFKGNLKTYL